MSLSTEQAPSSAIIVSSTEDVRPSSQLSSSVGLTSTSLVPASASSSSASTSSATASSVSAPVSTLVLASSVSRNTAAISPSQHENVASGSLSSVSPIESAIPAISTVPVAIPVPESSQQPMSSSALPSQQQIATPSLTQIQISKPSAIPADTDSMSEVVSVPLATSKPPVKVPTSPSAAISASASSSSSSPAPAAPPPPSAPPSTSVKGSAQATASNTRPSSQDTSKPVQTSAGPAASTSKTAFTTTSVQLIRASTTSTSTSTITTSAESTFTSAVPITITNASNGRIVLSTPPLVTVLSTSTEPDGSFLTFTHVVANPTGFNSGAAVNTSGFLQNQGAVAGVFVVVGIIAAAIATGLFFLFRRRRRLDRRRRWLAGMQQQRPPSMSGRSNPFADPHDSPVMRAVGDSNNMHWNAGGAGGVLYTDEPVAQEQTSVRGLAGVGTGRYTTRRPAPSDGPFDAPYDRGVIGLALTTNSQRGPVTRSAQSSPSIYPASLPAEDGNNAALWDQIDLNNQQPPKPTTDAPPPRPPRSHLRDTALRAFEYHPMTPPASVSSHAGSKPPSPTTEQVQSKGSPDNVFARRTLLDVRPRPPF